MGYMPLGIEGGTASPYIAAMPWKVSDPLSERMRFVARLLEGERMTDLCREFGISRKTGYKLKKRYQEEGPEALYDHSRRPRSNPGRTSAAIAERIIELRKAKPTWGPKKLKRRLEVLDPELPWPAASTIGVILKDAGLVDGRRRRRRASPTPEGAQRGSSSPNELWCIDFKGQFKLGNQQYCYPLTVTDHFSRFLVVCEGMEGTKADPVQVAMERAFRTYGLPRRILSDNGTPFASTGLGGLSKLAAWFLRLGIEPERIEPGHPEQNGRHERMHLTLKRDATRPPGYNILQQQEKLDAFVDCYNEERPHEALGQETPASAYRPSRRVLPEELPPVDYSTCDESRLVASTGRFYFRGKSYYLSKALSGQPIGLRQIEEHAWLIRFIDRDLAYLDRSADTVVSMLDASR